jgi:hypothetical protein
MLAPEQLKSRAPASDEPADELLTIEDRRPEPIRELVGA